MISTYKNQLHFYTLIINFLSEKEIKKTVPFTIALKIIKYLGINLTKEVKDLYIQNFKTLMKETEEGTNKWKVSCVHGLEELILLKCPYRPKASRDSMQSLPNFSEIFHRNRKKKLPKFVWNHKRSQIAEAILRKNEQS